MDGLSRSKSNTPGLIRARAEEAKFRREVGVIRKGQRQIDRKYRISERKNTATIRGITSLLGNDVYLDPGIKHTSVLYGQNIPGFCYKRNGVARRPVSIYQSKTSRVMRSLDGTEGVLEHEAANVVTDNPILDEILSCPDVLPILCDLRTTALLGRNPQLLVQFVNGLRQAAVDESLVLFPYTQDLATSLRKYRATLIKNLFEAIRIQAELRLNSAAREHGNFSMLEAATSGSGLFNGLQGFDSHAWNEALMNKLQEIADEENAKNSEPNHLEDEAAKDTVETENDTDSYWKIHPVSSVLDFAVPNINQGGFDFADDSDKPIQKTGRSKRNINLTIKNQYRSYLDFIVRSLINEVENVVTLGKMIREVRRKNPCKALCSIGLLEKLLKQDTFTSLNTKYCSLLQNQGKATNSEFEQCVAGVSSTDFGRAWDLVEIQNPMPVESLLNPRPDTVVDLRPTDTAPSFDFDEVLNGYHRMSARVAQSEKVKQQLKTKNRLCCVACKAKLRDGYQIVRERDQKFQKQIEEAAKATNVNVKKEIEKLKTVGSKNLAQTPFDLYKLSGRPSSSSSVNKFQSIHIQDSAVVDVTPSTLNLLPLSLALSSLPTSALGQPKVFPDLATPESYAPSPMPRLTVPAPSPRLQLPVSLQFKVKSKDRQRVAPKGQEPKTGQPSWTLKVSRYDLFKLRQELHRSGMEERLVKFTKHLTTQNAESRRNLPITDISFQVD